MPNIQFQTVVHGTPEQVYEYVTSFPVSGRYNQKTLEESYGHLIEHEGDTYTFQDETEDEVKWVCTFDPPRLRTMRSQDSKWADRLDWFEPFSGGTLWTAVWEPKATGFQAYVQWLGFKLRGKKQIYQTAVVPVVRHFQEVNTTRHRTLSRRDRRRRDRT